MNIDLTKLITGNCEEIIIEETLDIPADKLENTTIRELKNIEFKGIITKLYNDEYEIIGNITGIMILPDDITLEDVEYSFKSEIEEKFTEFNNSEEKSLQIIKNRLDITEFLWQNILVEIPLKVISEKRADVALEGNGWRLVTEDELKTRNNSPFNELSKIFDSRKE